MLPNECNCYVISCNNSATAATSNVIGGVYDGVQTDTDCPTASATHGFDVL